MASLTARVLLFAMLRQKYSVSELGVNYSRLSLHR